MSANFFDCAIAIEASVEWRGEEEDGNAQRENPIDAIANL